MLVYGWSMLVVSPAIHSVVSDLLLGMQLICFFSLVICSGSILFQVVATSNRIAAVHLFKLPPSKFQAALQSPLPKSVLSNRSRPTEFAWTRCILLNLLKCESAGVPPDPTSLGTPCSVLSAHSPTAQWSVLTTGHAGSIRPVGASCLGHPCMRRKVLGEASGPGLFFTDSAAAAARRTSSQLLKPLPHLTGHMGN